VRGFACGLERLRQNNSNDLAVLRDLRGFQRLNGRGGIATVAEQFCVLELLRVFVGYDVDDPTGLLMRHSSIVRGLRSGLPIRLVAALHDTSIEMIEKHCAAFIIDMTEDLARGGINGVRRASSPSASC
jgi:hypothetical protein